MNDRTYSYRLGVYVWCVYKSEGSPLTGASERTVGFDGVMLTYLSRPLLGRQTLSQACRGGSFLDQGRTVST